jgi:hypothetical protein
MAAHRDYGHSNWNSRMHCQDVHEVSQWGSWPVYTLISTIFARREVTGKYYPGAHCHIRCGDAIRHESARPKKYYKHRIRALRFDGRDQKQTIYEVSSLIHSVDTNIWSVYGRLGDYGFRTWQCSEVLPNWY